ncbi:MAG: glycoside hydrolase family 2 protein [Oscillospiraceae bacterium]|jgi:beta-galactosidase|nr:glycoside hydrolase family 2 protein [Oscillospiraceae bacterium]
MRSVTQLNKNWYFLAGDTPDHRPPRFRDKAWQCVDLPHAPAEGFGQYYWYCKSVPLERMLGERVYLRLDCPGANLRLFVDGKQVEKLRAGQVHVVELTQYHRRRRPLLIALRFRGQAGALLGGLPRGVASILVPQSHFSFDAKGAQGIAVSTQLVEGGAAKVKVNASVLLPSDGQKVTFAIGGPHITVPVTAAGAEFAIPRPRLWTPEDPFLYSLRAILTHQDGTHLDTVDVPFGVRSLTLHPQEGAQWNGVSVPLRGVLRQTPAPGQALPFEKERALLFDIGANALVLTGTPESAAYYDQCDAAGLRVFQTLPRLSDYKERKDGLDAAKKLVFALLNHPSIAGWIVHAQEESATRALCELVAHGDGTRPVLLQTNDAASLEAWGDLPAEGIVLPTVAKPDLPALDKGHATHPSRTLCLCTDAADDEELWPALGQLEVMPEVLTDRPWLNLLAGARLYPHSAADKGALLDEQNAPTDVYYLARALGGLKPEASEETSEGGDKKSAEPPAVKLFVHVCAVNPKHKNTVVVFSNAPAVTLTVNGKKIGTAQGESVFGFEKVKLKAGDNTVEAAYGETKHERVIHV